MRRWLRIAGLCALGLAGVVLAVGVALWLAFAPTREVVYREVDGAALRLLLFEPEAPNDGPRPAILFFYGGGWMGGSPRQFAPWAKHFAGRGWLGLTADYRVWSRHRTTPFAALADARAAYRFLRDHAAEWGVDPDRIVLAGGSAGGHLAAASVIAPWPDREGVPDPAALVLLNPALETRVDGDDDYLAGIAELFEGRGEEISPFHHVRGGLPRTFVAHGTADRIVPFEHSRVFCERMRTAGNVCELRAYEGAGHGFFNWGLGRFDDVISKVESFVAPGTVYAQPGTPF